MGAGDSSFLSHWEQKNSAGPVDKIQAAFVNNYQTNCHFMAVKRQTDFSKPRPLARFSDSSHAVYSEDVRIRW